MGAEAFSEKQLIMSRNREEEEIKKKGISLLTSSSMVVGSVAGSGFLALPFAIEHTGYIGILLIFLFAAVTAYTASLLGQCWTIIQERYPEHRGHVRHPYAVIGQIAYGRWCRLITSFCLNASMFGAGVVYLILSSQNIQDLLLNLFNVRMSFCYLLLVVTLVILPLTWLGSPKDFWLIGFTATAATAIACIIQMWVIIEDSLGPYKDVTTTHSSIEPLDFFQSMGVIFFAYGGHPAFPTIQNDMREPSRFNVVAYGSYLMTACMYGISTIPAYVVYGDKLEANVTLVVSPGVLLYVIQILLTCHLFFAYIIVMSPVVQEVDELLKINKQTVPRFGAFVAFVGGSAMMVLSTMFPCLLFLRLRSMEGPWPKMPVPLHTKVLCIEIIVVGAVIGVIAASGALNSMSASLPCYVNVTAADIGARG